MIHLSVIHPERMREEGEATLLGKADCTEIRRIAVRFYWGGGSPTVKEGVLVVSGPNGRTTANLYRCISLNNFLFRSASIVASKRLCVIAASRSPISR
jgi:hypothetical protein